MPVIRNERAMHLTTRAIALKLEDVRAEAHGLIASAQAEVNDIHAQARGEAEQLRGEILERARAEGEKAGYEAGFEKGRTDVMEQILAEALEPHKELLEKLVPEWVEQITQFSDERERLLEDARRELLSLAIELARRVVRRSIELDETVCVDQVAEAIELLGRPSSLRITISPLDRVVLERALPGVLERARLTEGIDLVESDELERGDCVVSTAEGSVDSRIETQLARITDTLLPGDDV